MIRKRQHDDGQNDDNDDGFLRPSKRATIPLFDRFCSWVWAHFASPPESICIPSYEPDYKDGSETHPETEWQHDNRDLDDGYQKGFISEINANDDDHDESTYTCKGKHQVIDNDSGEASHPSESDLLDTLEPSFNSDLWGSSLRNDFGVRLPSIAPREPWSQPLHEEFSSLKTTPNIPFSLDLLCRPSSGSIFKESNLLPSNLSTTEYLKRRNRKLLAKSIRERKSRNSRTSKYSLYISRYVVPLKQLMAYKEVVEKVSLLTAQQFEALNPNLAKNDEIFGSRFDYQSPCGQSDTASIVIDDTVSLSFVYSQMPSLDHRTATHLSSPTKRLPVVFGKEKIRSPFRDEREDHWLSKLRLKLDESINLRLPTNNEPGLHLHKNFQEGAKEIDRAIEDLRNKPIVPETDRSLINFPELPRGAVDKLSLAMAPGKAVVISEFNVDLTKADIQTLQDGHWLNDEVINFYGQLVMARAKSQPEVYPKIHIFNTFFYSSLRDTGYSKVRRWTKKFDIFALDYVIFPVHLHVHWCCGVINFKKKRIEYYDSLNGRNSQFFELMRLYLTEEHRDKKKAEIDLFEWKDYQPADCPTQQNGYDCGVFTAMIAEFISREEPLCLGQEHMRYFRRRMAYEIITKTLLVSKE